MRARVADDGGPWLAARSPGKATGRTRDPESRRREEPRVRCAYPGYGMRARVADDAEPASRP